jgi:hypothetical protein
MNCDKCGKKIESTAGVCYFCETQRLFPVAECPSCASLRARIEVLECRLNDREKQGRIMHESWTRTKRAQGFHHPKECHADNETMCDKCHWDLCDWSELPEKQKDINRHAFDDVLAWLKEGKG